LQKYRRINKIRGHLQVIGVNKYCKGRFYEKGYTVRLHREGNNPVGRDVTDEPVVKKNGFSGGAARGWGTDAGIESWICTGATDRAVSDQCMVRGEPV
jgi:hypothetical protein